MQDRKEEFLTVLESYQGILHKVCLVYFRSEADREDMFQEIVYQLWKSWSRRRHPHIQEDQEIPDQATGIPEGSARTPLIHVPWLRRCGGSPKSRELANSSKLIHEGDSVLTC